MSDEPDKQPELEKRVNEDGSGNGNVKASDALTIQTSSGTSTTEQHSHPSTYQITTTPLPPLPVASQQKTRPPIGINRPPVQHGNRAMFPVSVVKTNSPQATPSQGQSTSQQNRNKNLPPPQVVTVRLLQNQPQSFNPGASQQQMFPVSVAGNSKNSRQGRVHISQRQHQIQKIIASAPPEARAATAQHMAPQRHQHVQQRQYVQPRGAHQPPVPPLRTQHVTQRTAYVPPPGVDGKSPTKTGAIRKVMVKGKDGEDMEVCQEMEMGASSMNVQMGDQRNVAGPSSAGIGVSDDYTFKKPFLPAVKKVGIPSKEDKKKEITEDEKRVQMHMMEATRRSQEAEALKLAQRTAASIGARVVQVSKTPISASQAPRREAPPEVPPTPPPPEADTQRVILNNDYLEVPNLLVHSAVVFRYVVSKHAYKSLSEESRRHLRTFLPDFQTAEEENTLLDCAFTRSQTLVHGNPIDLVQTRMKQGWYSPEGSDSLQLCNDNKVLYDHFIRLYYMNLFPKLLVSRQSILIQLDDKNVSKKFKRYKNPECQKEKEEAIYLKKRAAKRTRMMVTDCRTKVGENGISSDEEVEDIGPPICKALQNTSCQKSTLYTNKHKDFDMYQPMQCDDLKTMLKKYKKLKRKDKHTPSLQTQGIVLDEVFDRAGVLAQSEKIKQTVAALEQGLKE